VNFLDQELGALAALYRPEEVDSLLDQAAAIFPDRYEAMWSAGKELRAHGQAEAALAVFQRCIEWLRERPPEEVDRANHQRRLAMMLYLTEHWEEAHAIYRAVAEEQPDDLFLLGMEGRSAARMGDTASAREMSARIAEMPWPEDDYEHYYVRGILAALLGEPDEAMRLIREAFERGKFFAPSLHLESDLESLYPREDWQEFIRPKG
jgi:tetratricopeptide (TPR) repeat protein